MGAQHVPGKPRAGLRPALHKPPWAPSSPCVVAAAGHAAQGGRVGHETHAERLIPRLAQRQQPVRSRMQVRQHERLRHGRQRQLHGRRQQRWRRRRVGSRGAVGTRGEHW